MNRSTLKTAICFAAVLILAIASTAPAQTTATLKGKFTYDGDVPQRKELPCNTVINKDQQVCCKITHYDDSLVVNKDGGVANTVVYVRTTGLKVPDDLAAKSKEPVLLDNKNCRFEPHVVGLLKGQKLLVGNSDNTGHNTNIGGQNFNQIIAIGKMSEIDVKTLTPIPNAVQCNIHSWMNAWVLVRPDPFFAISAEDGTFEIKGLPTDKELEFQVWHEKSGFVTTVKLKDKATTWDKGRFKQKLAVGDNDLGDIKVSPKIFNK